MYETIALIGAGGKMGMRIANNLAGKEYRVFYSEKAEAGIARLKEKGLGVTSSEEAVLQADFVVLAVPDRLIGEVSSNLVPLARSGAVVILLDPAAAVLGKVAARQDLDYVVCHPCHPPLFGKQSSPPDYFGGIAAEQDIVIALMRGREESFEAAKRLCCKMFAPVREAYRVTVEQMAILEPAMAEVVVASAACLMKEAMEEAIRAGVPREAAQAFMMGHAQIALAIAFGAIDSPFSDAARVAIRWGNEMLYRPDWRKIFQPEMIRAVISEMIQRG